MGHVSLSFTAFDLEAQNSPSTTTASPSRCVSDCVSIYECYDFSCTSKFNLAHFDGNNVPQIDLTSRTGYLQLVFTKVRHSNSSGFEAHWSVGADLENDQKYQFVPESGFRASNDNGNFTKAELVKVKDRELTEIDKHKLKTLTQAAIAACLDGKDLNSRSTFKRLS